MQKAGFLSMIKGFLRQIIHLPKSSKSGKIRLLNYISKIIKFI